MRVRPFGLSLALLLAGCASSHGAELDAGSDAEVQDGAPAERVLVTCDGLEAGGWGVTARAVGDQVAIVCQADGTVADAVCLLGEPCDCEVPPARFELAQGRRRVGRARHLGRGDDRAVLVT